MSQNRPWVSVGVALVAAGAVAVPLSDVRRVVVQLASGAEAITIDFVRHGESVDNAEGILGTTPPGAALTDLGRQQAHDVATLIQAGYPNGIDEIYTSELIRTQQTAESLSDLLGISPQVLPGLDEVNAGWLEGAPLTTFTQIGYVLPTLMWILGLRFVPMLGSTVDPNGMAFQDRVSDAVQAIYNATSTDPQHPITDVAFSSAGTIAAWTLMNVKNPDFAPALKGLIEAHAPVPNAGQVVIEGSPQEGWTLLSWNGTDVSPEPDLLTSLFVDLRTVITAPQMALWHLWESIIGADATSITSAVPAAFDDGLTGALNDGAATAGAAVGDVPVAVADLPAV